MTLLPCPFCARQPTVEPTDPKTQGDAWTRIACDCAAAPSVEVCQEKGHHEKAVRVWNRRRPATQAVSAKGPR